MTERDIQKISEEYKDEKEPLYEKIHERVENMIVQQAKKRKRLKTFYKVFPVSLAMVLIISLAIVLPIVLQPTEEEQPLRYSATELDAVELNYTLKEYARQNNENYLYIDLYDNAEETVTLRYFEINNESRTAFLQESFNDGDMGYAILLTIMKKNVAVDGYDQPLPSQKEMTINDVTITYGITTLNSKAKFEYLDYKYYLEFDDEIPVEYLTEIITNMFNTEKAVA